MNKLLKTAIVGTALLTVPHIAFADDTATETTNGVSVTGTYEGTLTDSGTYTQSVDLVVLGTSDDGTVTMNVDETGTVGDVYVDTTLLGSLDLRLGKVDGVNGMKVSTTIAGFTVSAYQPSGSNQSLEIGAGADVRSN